MPDATETDVVVVGSGPNGLAAAVTLARAGLGVTVVERADEPGGAARTVAATLPGFVHDLGAAVHPMAFASPFFRRFRIAERVPFAVPEMSFAHLLQDGRAVPAWRDLGRTAAALGPDGPAYRRLLGPLADRAAAVGRFTLSAVLRVPPHPDVALRFGLAVLAAGVPAVGPRWRTEAAPALLAGAMAHTNGPVPSVASAAPGLALVVAAHAGGWPVPIGGTGRITAALVDDLLAHGGRLETGREVDDLGELPRSRAVVLDTAVPALLRIAGRRIPAPVATWLSGFRFGRGIGKVDFALSGPVPWRDAVARTTATLHLGGTAAQITAAEAAVAEGRVPESPYVLVAQPSVLDPSRAPEGRHALWAYTHLPNGSTLDPTELITAAIERVAPGFRDLVLAANPQSAQDVAAWNPNLGGGDIGAGALTLRQLVARPVPWPDPWHLGRGVYLCSAAAAPGPGVHGMGGYLAARSLLAREFGIRTPPTLA